MPSRPLPPLLPLPPAPLPLLLPRLLPCLHYYVTSHRSPVREGWSSETQISEYVLPGKKVEFFDPRNSRKFLVVFKRYVSLTYKFIFAKSQMCHPFYILFQYLHINVLNHIRSEDQQSTCLLYTSPSPRDGLLSRMPSSA